MNLEEIIRISDGLAGEILIGYDGDLKEIPSSFRTQPHARIVPLKWEGYSITKNKLASEAKHDWILSLDGDEIPDEELLLQITSLPFESLPIHQTYALKRVSFFKGKKITHGAWGRDRVLRLYNKRYTQWNGAVVHEDLQKKTDTTVLLLKGELRHYTAEDYEFFLAKNKRYAMLVAEKYFESGKKSPFWKRLISPVFTFVKEYVFQAGFFDGMAGIEIAKVNALYTYWKYQYLQQKYQE